MEVMKGEQMTEEIKEGLVNVEQTETPKAQTKAKRDIIRFSGERSTAINLEHVTNMYVEGKRITFEFYAKAQFVDFADDSAAASVFEVILNTWSSEIEIKDR
jgi:hypothetical protein